MALRAALWPPEMAAAAMVVAGSTRTSAADRTCPSRPPDSHPSGFARRPALSAVLSAFHRPGRSRWPDTPGRGIRGGPETATADLGAAGATGRDADVPGTNDARVSSSRWYDNANPMPAHTTVAAAVTAVRRLPRRRPGAAGVLCRLGGLEQLRPLGQRSPGLRLQQQVEQLMGGEARPVEVFDTRYGVS